MARVLVADDSETILLLLRTRLEMEGHEVETAADGQEVVDAVRRAPDNPPDILLLDAMMPRKSGIDALRELRAEGIEAPALIVSAHTDGGDDNGDRAELGIDGYITKPIDFERLFARIVELTRPGPTA
jgi:DNA-binding response OmpR family regulator